MSHMISWDEYEYVPYQYIPCQFTRDRWGMLYRWDRRIHIAHGGPGDWECRIIVYCTGIEDTDTVIDSRWAKQLELCRMDLLRFTVQYSSDPLV